MLYRTEIIEELEKILHKKEHDHNNNFMPFAVGYKNGYIEGIKVAIAKINELVDKELEDMFKDYLKNERGCEL